MDDADKKQLKGKFILLTEKQADDLRSVLSYGIELINGLYAKKRVVENIPLDYVINGVCNFFGTTREGLRQYCRRKDLVIRRKITCYIAHTYTDASLHEIGKELGYTSHATVLHHIKHIKDALSKEFYGDEDIKYYVKRIINLLNLDDYENTEETNQRQA